MPTNTSCFITSRTGKVIVSAVTTEAAPDTEMSILCNSDNFLMAAFPEEVSEDEAAEVARKVGPFDQF